MLAGYPGPTTLELQPGPSPSKLKASRRGATITRNPNPVTRNPKAKATPAAAEGPRQGDVLFHPRVHHEHRGVAPVVCGGSATGSPAVAALSVPQVPPPPTQLLFSVKRRRWNSNRSRRHLSRRFFLRKQGGVTEARAVKPPSTDPKPGRESVSGRHLNSGQNLHSCARNTRRKEAATIFCV